MPLPEVEEPLSPLPVQSFIKKPSVGTWLLLPSVPDPEDIDHLASKAKPLAAAPQPLAVTHAGPQRLESRADVEEALKGLSTATVDAKLSTIVGKLKQPAEEA